MSTVSVVKVSTRKQMNAFICSGLRLDRPHQQLSIWPEPSASHHDLRRHGCLHRFLSSSRYPFWRQPRQPQLQVGRGLGLVSLAPWEDCGLHAYRPHLCSSRHTLGRASRYRLRSMRSASTFVMRSTVRQTTSSAYVPRLPSSSLMLTVSCCLMRLIIMRNGRNGSQLLVLSEGVAISWIY